MNQVVTYLQSKEAIFHGAICLMLLYVPHSGSLFMQLEHLDMTFHGFTFMNWFYGMALALIIEFLILIFIINGNRATGKFYAIVSFCLNVCYYDYVFVTIGSPTGENIKTAVVSLLICLTHSLSVWQLSELFYERVTADKEKTEYWCPDCEPACRQAGQVHSRIRDPWMVIFRRLTVRRRSNRLQAERRSAIMP